MRYVLSATVNTDDFIGEVAASKPLDLNQCFDHASHILRSNPKATSFVFVVVRINDDR